MSHLLHKKPSLASKKCCPVIRHEYPFTLEGVLYFKAEVLCSYDGQTRCEWNTYLMQPGMCLKRPKMVNVAVSGTHICHSQKWSKSQRGDQIPDAFTVYVKIHVEAHNQAHLRIYTSRDAIAVPYARTRVRMQSAHVHTHTRLHTHY